MKKCQKCNVEKDEEEFYTAGTYHNKSRKDLTCKSCRNAAIKERIYGISESEYAQLYEAQEGKCRICNAFQERLCIDHCHDSKIIRGLICSKCNLILGQIKDNIYLLQSMIEYIQRAEEFRNKQCL